MRSGPITGDAHTTHFWCNSGSGDDCRQTDKNIEVSYSRNLMGSDSQSTGERGELSMRDRLLLIPFGASALLAFALSFTVTQPDGRPYLFCGCLALCVVCLALAKERKAMVGGTVLFIALRLIWSISIIGLGGLLRRYR